MVFFVCEGCNESLKKNQVDKHASFCSACWAVTCVDCNVTFEGDDYRQHTSCISEAQKYEGALYRGPKKGGETGSKKKKGPQEIWMEVVEQAAAESQQAPANIRSMISNLSGFGNVPRNQNKFCNFVKNSLRVRSEPMIKQIWEFLQQRQTAAVAASAAAAPPPPNTPSAAMEAAGTGANKPGSVTTSKGAELDKSGKKRKRDEAKEEEKEERGAEEKRRSKKSSEADQQTLAIDWERAAVKCIKKAPTKSLSAKELRKAVYRFLGKAASAGAVPNRKALLKTAISQSKKLSTEGKGGTTIVSLAAKKEKSKQR